MPKKKDKKTVYKDDHGLVIANPFKRYLYEANKYPLLSEEEEKSLTLQYKKTMDPEIAKRLVLSNLRLVVKIAMEYYYKVFCNLTDLVQEGNTGLLMAVKKYKPEKEIRFPSYAQFWIRAYMLKFLMDSFSLVKIGTTKNQKKVFYNLSKAREAIERLGFKAEPKLLAQYIGVKDSDVKIMEQRMHKRDISIDTPLEEDGSRTVQDTLGQEPAFEKEVEKQDLYSRVQSKLSEFRSRLKNKEAYIWDHRTLPENKMTLKDIANQHNVSKERIRQIEERLMKKLKKFWEEEARDLSINDIVAVS